MPPVPTYTELFSEPYTEPYTEPNTESEKLKHRYSNVWRLTQQYRFWANLGNLEVEPDDAIGSLLFSDYFFNFFWLRNRFRAFLVLV